MELFEPKNFFQMAELLANVFTGLIAIGGLLIALATYEVAQKALREWKNEKSHNIDDEAIIYMNDAISKIRDMSYSYSDYDSLEDFEKKEADKIFSKSQDYWEDYVKHKYYWNKHANNTEQKTIKNIALKVFRNSQDKEIIQFYRDYIFLTNTLFSIIMNYYAERLNNHERKHKITNVIEPTDLRLDIFKFIPKNTLKLHKKSTKIEIAYNYFTGEGLNKWLKKLTEIEIKFYLQTKAPN